MTDAAWAHHANSYSVYPRFGGAIAISFALWSAYRIGRWSLTPIVAAGGRVCFNPRFFAPPGTVESGAARGVLGERASLNRDQVPIVREPVDVAFPIANLPGLLMANRHLELWTQRVPGRLCGLARFGGLQGLICRPHGVAVAGDEGSPPGPMAESAGLVEWTSRHDDWQGQIWAVTHGHLHRSTKVQAFVTTMT